MSLFDWKSTIRDKFDNAERLRGNKPLSDEGKAELTAYAREEHAFGRAMVGGSAGVASGLVGGMVALAAGLPPVASLFAGAAVAIGVYRTGIGQWVFDLIEEPPPQMPTIEDGRAQRRAKPARDFRGARAPVAGPGS